MGRYDDPRWQKLRLRTFERDNWTCQGCNATTKPLHAHHKRYAGELWETPLDDLQTLCEDCHAGLGRHSKAGAWYEDGKIVGPNAADTKEVLASRCEAEFCHTKDGGVSLIFWDREGIEVMALGVNGDGDPSLKMFNEHAIVSVITGNGKTHPGFVVETNTHARHYGAEEIAGGKVV